MLFHAMPPVARQASEASFFCDTLPPKACLWVAMGHLYANKWGCSSDTVGTKTIYIQKKNLRGINLCNVIGYIYIMKIFQELICVV